VLGDDALACLRDLKRWLKLYDEKANRLDVARCLAESNLVGGDLLQILAAWPENATDDKFKSRIALACLELLVPLTWPLERVGEMTVNHHRHTPYLQLAQLGYKRSIINFDGARILHTAVRVALPSMAVAMKDRSSRDEGMIKLVLYFIRNIAMIAPPSTVKYDGENEISRSATIDAFDYQDVLHLILALSSSMGEDFNTQDVVVMEILFHLVKGVDLEKLFMNEKQLDNRKIDELVSLRNQEAGMQRGYARTAPSRHGRFGTMIWIKRDDEKMSTVSGQDALINGARSLEKMDKSKKFKPPRRLHKGITGPMDYITPVPLSPRASKNLRKFVEDFLDSGFNPLFQHLRKAMDREAERILDDHHRQFFFLISWFLEAERFRRKSKQADKSKSKQAIATEIDDSFGLVASVLNQEMFITINRAMAKNYEEHAWDNLQATMKCFTQILLTVQEMSDSKIEDDQEIAENILSRIFYEDTTHDMVAGVVRTFKDQGFGYLDACTELAHVYIRILENYSKQNENLQVRSMRRRRKKKRQVDNEGDPEFSEGSDDQADAAQAERSSRERKFDFKRFATKFLTQGSIDTFVKLCGYYQDLKPDQLKRVHRFFYRIAFKMEMSVMLFRVDIIALLHKMVKGPEGLDPAGKAYKEWDELVRQILKKCMRKIQERPELIVEMLFSKTNNSAYFLEYGHYKQTVTGKPSPAAELQVKGGMEWEKQIGVVVSAMLDRNEGHHLEWIKGQLMAGETERRAWEAANFAMPSVENADGETPAPADPPQSPSIGTSSLKCPRKKGLIANMNSTQTQQRRLQDRHVQKRISASPHDPRRLPTPHLRR
jgi:replication fork protection complex subunit Tof1/Swi1